MTRMRKMVSALLVGTMAVSLLAGCGAKNDGASASSEAAGAASEAEGAAETDAAASETAATGDETVIKFGIHVANPQEQEAVTYNIVEGFNEKYAGTYKVEFVAADTESHSKNMKLAAQDGTLPEIIHLDSAEAPEYNEAGYLLDLSDFLAKNADVDTALNGMEDAFAADGAQYGLPYQCNVQGFFYNKELFDAANVEYPTDETTYEDFITMIGALKDSGVTPIAIGSKNSAFSMWEFNEFLSRYGWEENIADYTAEGATYSNADLTACYEKIKGIADAGAFPENMATIEYFDAKQLFNEGKAAMFGTGQWDCAEFDENLGDKVGFWWGPVFTDSAYSQEVDMKVPSAPIVVSAAAAEDDAVKEAVYAFLAYYYSEDAAKISYEGSIFPATNYAGVEATDSQYAMNAMISALGNGWTTPAAAPDQTVSAAVQQAMYDSMFGVMQGTYSPEEALATMDSAAAN